MPWWTETGALFPRVKNFLSRTHFLVVVETTGFNILAIYESARSAHKMYANEGKKDGARKRWKSIHINRGRSETPCRPFHQLLGVQTSSIVQGLHTF